MTTTSEVTVSPESVTVAGRTRTLTVVHRPQARPGPAPIVLVFHGSTRTAAAIRSFTASTSAARTDGVDEVAFAKAAIDLLQHRYGGDNAQVYANGGQMVIRLIHEIPSALAGAAVLAATQPVPENFAPDSPRQRPFPSCSCTAPRTRSSRTPVEGPRCTGSGRGGSACPPRRRLPATHGVTASPPRPRAHRRKWTAPTTVSRAARR